jgi:vitamin B12 transporter
MKKINNINKMLVRATLVASLTASFNVSAVLGPIPIYLNTEYRTSSPVIGSIASTISFDSEDIKQSGANDFIGFLATIPSVGLFNPQGNSPSVFMRGGESNHTLFIIDGVKLNSANSLNGGIEYGLRNIPLNDIEKIEIIKGSGSVLYGSSAIAGVVAITTKKGGSKEFATSVNYGSNNSKRVDILASSGDKDSYIRLSHNNYSTDGISARSDNDEKDGVENQNSNFKFGVKNDKSAFDISYLKSNNKTEYDNCGFPSSNDCYLDRKLTKSSVSIDNEFNKNWNTKLTFAKINTIEKLYANNALSAGSDDVFKSTDLTILNDIKIDNALLNIGFSKLDDENTTKNKEISNNDIFVNFQKNISQIDINIGSRYINNSKFGNELVYSFGAGKYLNNGVKIIANYNTSFKTPTLKNLYGWNFSGIGGGGNENLQPETAKNLEFGFERQHSWGEVKATIYQNKVKGLIDWIGVGYVNTHKLKTKGLEFSINANVKDYFIEFAYNYNDSKKNEETTQSVRRPKNTINLSASRQYGKFNSKVQIISKSSSLDTGSVKLNGYSLVNLATSYDLNDDAKLSLNINNAFDKDYEVANNYNQLGRTFNLGLSYKF